MVFQIKSTLIGLIALSGLGQGVRMRRQSSAQMSVAGVQIHNYNPDMDDFIILFKEGTSDTIVHADCDGSCKLMGHPDKGGLAFAEVKGMAKLEQLLLKHAGDIKFVESDTIDSAFSGAEEGVEHEWWTSWGLDRVGKPNRVSTGKGVHIYVQDSGVRKTHTDFGGRAITAIDVTDGEVYDCARGWSRCALDTNGHGTHCAATTAGNTHGLATDAIVHGVKTLNSGGNGARSWQIAALDWISTNGEKPAVISMSLGGSGQDQAYEDVLNLVINSGFAVVVAAGNAGADACGFVPAYVPAVITVGATDSANARAGYSNFGSCNDIMAPGSNIMSAGITSDYGSTSKDGTSMACPHVSGAVALLMESNTSITQEDALIIILENARKGYISNLKPGDPDAFLNIDGF